AGRPPGNTPGPAHRESRSEGTPRRAARVQAAARPPLGLREHGSRLGSLRRLDGVAARGAEASLGGHGGTAADARDRRSLTDGAAAVGAEVRAPEDRCAALAARSAPGNAPRGGCVEESVELEQPLLERGEIGAPLVDEVVPEALLPVHLEHEPAEVADPLLAQAQERAPLAAELGGGRRWSPRRGRCLVRSGRAAAGA